MTKRIGDVIHIEREDPAECELCGKIAELRPYGPNGEHVCYACGMKDEAAAKRAFARLIEGADHLTVDAEQLAKAHKQ